MNKVEDYCRLAKLIEECKLFHITELVPMAKYIMDKGYGNIKEALTEFAERLKTAFWSKHYIEIFKQICKEEYKIIDETLKEFLKQ